MLSSRVLIISTPTSWKLFLGSGGALNPIIPSTKVGAVPRSGSSKAIEVSFKSVHLELKSASVVLKAGTIDSIVVVGSVVDGFSDEVEDVGVSDVVVERVVDGELDLDSVTVTVMVVDSVAASVVVVDSVVDTSEASVTSAVVSGSTATVVF
ncbi:unnamed protein product [Caenorhabditis auriculariae]|uniref:Uncharacterized protein n=1 Tax=Caenorhabditis auriculariae TaxID=2777116 RepID=A0A8S1HFL0_9PELO|nr:unnamed protein product [Caenorhabditis auriculariae]